MLHEAMTATSESERPRGLPEGWQDPKTWSCLNKGICRVKVTDEGVEHNEVNDGPIWISRRWADYDTKVQTVEVSFIGGKSV
ncbi:hypothetical protein, partial [Acinetobacter baumannii]|uniref:hypothetical protein n=1 Tax=Acinetobacter baumannii TaxID=470 RepID=UPI003AF77E03